MNSAFRKLCTVQKSEIVKCAFADLCRFAKVAFAEKCAVQICAFCAQTVFADLQICAFVFCTFVNCFCAREKFFRHVCICDFVFVNMREHKISKFSHFAQKSQNLSNLTKNSKKSKFPKMSRKCPKKAHVFLSGTRVVPGPTRLTTQGGKSRQNMH